MFKTKQNKQERKGKMKWLICSTLLFALAFSGFKSMAQVTYITPDQLSTSANFTIDADGTYVLAAKDEETGLADPTLPPTTFNGRLVIANGKNVVLYLNGHTMKCDANYSIINHKGASLSVYGTYPGGNTGGVFDGGNTARTVYGRAIYSNTTANSSLIVDGVIFKDCNSGSYTGGGICAADNRTVTVNNCTFQNCRNSSSGGAIAAGSHVVVNVTNTNFSNCVCSTSGAAIHATSYSDISVSNTTIEDCTANSHAAGIYGGNYSTINVTQTTFDNCQSKGDGGAIFSNSYGTVNFNGGTISNCFANTGGGVYVNTGGEFTMNAGTIMHCYAVKDYNTEFVQAGSPGADGYVGGGVCAYCSTMNMNGGSILMCHAGTGSGAIHTWTEGGNRAYLYINGPTCLISNCDSYSYAGCTHVGNGSHCVMSAGEVSYNVCQSGTINANGGAFEVGFAAGSRFEISGGKIRYNRALRGTGSGAIGMGGGIFMRESGSTGGSIIITGGEISNNYADDKGGGIYARISVEVTGAKICDNTAGVDGGGIYFQSSCHHFTFNSGEISGNQAGNNGGALYFDNFQNNSITLVEGVFEGNVASNYGGGVYMENSKITFGADGDKYVSFTDNEAVLGGGLYIKTTGSTKRDITLNNSHFINNSVTDCGGAIYLEDNGKSTLFLKQGAEFTQNTAAVDGGAIFVDRILAVSMEDGDFEQNVATSGRGGAMYIGTGSVSFTKGSATYNQAYDGGAFYANGGSLTINGAADNLFVVSNNHATHDGAGFYANGGAVSVTNAELDSNYAENDGGAFYANTGVTVVGATMIGNNADHFGGAYCAAAGNSTISGNSSINMNTAGYGGGVYVNGNLSITDTDITSNQAAYDGGGAYSNTGVLTINAGVDVTNNSAQENGGGFYVNEGGTITMVGGSISNNSADADGGGIYTKGSFNLGDGVGSCELTLNSAGNNGGAVYVEGGNVVINNGVVQENTATVNGGGIYTKGNLTMDAGFIAMNEARNGGGMYLEEPAVATLTNGGVSLNRAIIAGGIYVCKNSTLNLYKQAQVTENECYNNYDGGLAGGIYQNGIMNVAGTEIRVCDNVSSNLLTSKASNVYLPDDDNYITIVDWTDPVTGTVYTGLTDAVNIGITVPEVPRAVVHSETPYADGHIEDLYQALHDHQSSSLLKDDINKYSAVWADGPDPYNLNDIFFTATWQVGALEDLPEGVSQFADGDLGTQAEINAYFKNINTEAKLARFMCYVNGLEGYSPHPNQIAKVTEDLYMDKYIWLPIGANDGRGSYLLGDPQPYTGKFDGGGNVIQGLRTIGLVGLTTYGLFGSTYGAQISNTFVSESEFVSSNNDTLGIVIGKMVKGKLYYAEGAGKLTSSGPNSIMGGLVGYEENATINSCMAMADMTGATMGGLIGKMSALGDYDLEIQGNCYAYNCFANPKFHTINALPTSYSGGLVGYQYLNSQDFSRCRLSECYVRLDRDHTLLPGAKISLIAGKQGNFTDIQNVYVPTDDYCGGIAIGLTDRQKFVYEVIDGDVPFLTNIATFEPVSDPGTYYYDPAQDTRIVTVDIGTIPNPRDRRLLPQMQAAAYRRNLSHPNPPVCYWKRTGANEFMASGTNINSDYPVLDFDSVSPLYVHSHVSEFYDEGYCPYYIALGSKDGIVLDYCPSFSGMLRRYNYYEGGGTINLFHSTDNSAGMVKITDDDVRVFFDEGVTILQGEGGYLNAVSYQTLRDGTVDYWHTFSTVMRDSKIGIKYGKLGQVPYSNSTDPCSIFLDDGNESTPNSNNTLFPYNTPTDSLDFYAFFEPDFHWINFKRNSNSHWAMNDVTTQLHYSNEEILVPGKGYLIALQPSKTIYEYGVLNCGNITSSSRYEDCIHLNADGVYEGAELRGYNLMGNPYQAYLDFDKFAQENSELWSGSSTLDYTCFIYDPDEDAYMQHTANMEGSKGTPFPNKWLAPHQGFFIVKSNEEPTAPMTARFIETGTNGMCDLTGDEGLLRGESRDYPLVNLYVYDEKHHGDVVSVEFDRPEFAGSNKQKALRSGDAVISVSYENNDYAQLFLDEAVESLPIHFDCSEGGTYTMNWNTANGRFTTLTLVDNFTGVSTDCLTHDSYTFEATPVDYKSRFKLILAYSDEEEPENEETISNFAFISNGDLIVNGQGYMEIMDVNGHVLVTSRLTDTQNRVSIPDVAAGVYIIRLNEKAQKIVIQ